MEGIVVILLMCNTMVIVNAGGGVGYGNQWDYIKNSAIGPSKWGTNYPACNGNKQSPIDILSRDVKYEKSLGKLVLKNYEYKEKDFYFEMHNRNTDIEFQGQVNGTLKYVPQELTFQGITYRFFQFHFHWGSNSTKGSEHQIDSQRFAAEMHIIHFNTKYPNVSVAINQTDGLLVWGHMLKVDSSDKADQPIQKLFNTFESNIKNVTKGGSKKNVTSFSLYDILPKDHDNFFHYNGSLTTPGCFQSVKWVINKVAISVNEKQMILFRQLKDNAKTPEVPLENHFRPIQKINGRVVQRNFVESPKKAAGIVAKPYFVVILVMAIVLAYIG